jgi:asparagine synthase (glutamine-hydrolysing)
VERYYEKTRDGKLIMRALLKRYVPEDIADGVKQGFSAPDASWFRGESMDYVRRRLFAPDARIFDVLDRQAITTLLNEHLEGRKNRRLLIWSLLCLEEFMRCFLSGEKLFALPSARRDGVQSPFQSGPAFLPN